MPRKSPPRQFNSGRLVEALAASELAWSFLSVRGYTGAFGDAAGYRRELATARGLLKEGRLAPVDQPAAGAVITGRAARRQGG